MSAPRISWSGLKRYENCPQRHLNWVNKQTKVIVDGRVFLQGQIVDLVSRGWLMLDNPPLGWMEEQVPELLRRLTNPRTEEERLSPDRSPVYKWRGDPVADRAKVEAFCIQAVRNLEPLLVKHVLPYDWQADLRFRVPVGVPFLDGKPSSVELIGAMDIVVRDGNGDFLIIDVKATEDAGYLRSTIGQGYFYWLAVRHWWGDPEQPKRFAFFSPMTKQQVIPVQPTPDDLKDLVRRIIKMAHGIWRGEWDPKEDDEGCFMCESKHVCLKYAAPILQDNVGRNRASFEAAAAARKPVLGAVDG